METFDTFTTACPITDRRLRKLARRIDRAASSSQSIRIIRAVAETRHPDAVELLAALLDYPGGPVARAVVRALVSFGDLAVPAMRRVITESLDGDAIAHAEMVLERILRPMPLRVAGAAPELALAA